MATATGTRLERDTMATLDWIGVGLAVLLGIAYIPTALGALPSVFGIAFLLAGLGYFGAVVLVLAAYRRRQVYAVGIGYNALLVVLYFLLNPDPASGLVGLAGAVKLGQVLFAALLGVLLVRGR